MCPDSPRLNRRRSWSPTRSAIGEGALPETWEVVTTGWRGQARGSKLPSAGDKAECKQRMRLDKGDSSRGFSSKRSLSGSMDHFLSYLPRNVLKALSHNWQVLRTPGL